MPFRQRDARRDEELSANERVELSLRFYQLKLPARLDEANVGAVLGIPANCVIVLRKNGLLTALGDPSQQTPKYYATVTVLHNASDPVWLDRMTRVLSDHWRRKNCNRSAPASRFSNDSRKDRQYAPLSPVSNQP
jgi:hypothetical protein